MDCLKLAFLFLSLCVVLSVQVKVKVSVYYESLCPDCKTFIRGQLYPTYKKLNSVMEVDLIPYGKAAQNYVNGKWEFSCQHGPSECLGNKMQSCALNQNYTEEINVEFVNCVMSQNNPAQAGEMCANSIHGVSWTDINECVNSPLGDDLLAANGNRTHSLNPQVSFIPTIIFNDVYNYAYMWESLSNLKAVICQILANPPVCSSAKKTSNYNIETNSIGW